MAYKKYIKRDGKIYGPYIYHSKRVDGKVVSEYHGQGKKEYTKFIFVTIGILFLVSIVYFLGFSQRGITGHAVFDINADYQEGEALSGKLKMSLQEGEFIPADSKVVFNNAGNSYEYTLSEVVSEPPSSTTAGEGYGIPGEKEIFSFVDFILIVEKGIEGDNETVQLSEVQGQASRDSDFVYVLGEGETNAELKLKSVKVNGEEFPDNTVKVDKNGGEITVTTDYFEIEEGFGEGYAGTEVKEMEIDLASLGLVLEPGELKVSVFDGEEEKISLTTTLSSGQIDESVEPTPTQDTAPDTQTTDPNEPEVIETIDEPLVVPSVSSELTVEEREVLENEFGNASVQITKAISKNGFIVIRYEIGEYWVENSYSRDLDNVTLESYMSSDRIKWLKDVARLISSSESGEGEIVEGYVGSNFGV